MQRQRWHDNFLKSLEELADISLQTQAWVDGDHSLLPSPTELICQTFDDSGFDEMLEAGLVFSNEADTVLREMGDLASQVDLEQPPRDLLGDPSWQTLSVLAGKALASVKRSLSTDC